LQNLVEREAAHAKEKAALESAQAQAKWELEARIRDLEGELRQALQGEGFRNDPLKLRGQRPS
jgi:carotenoid cleavage dioxygenase-like enzyme